MAYELPTRKPRKEPSERRLLETINAKKLSPQGFEPAAYGPVGPVALRLQFRILREDNFFVLIVLRSRRSGCSFLGFCVGKRPESTEMTKLVEFFLQIKSKKLLT